MSRERSGSVLDPIPGPVTLTSADGGTEDQIRRAKLRAKGWKVVAIAASAPRDHAALAVHLNELAIYLGRDDLLNE